MKLDLFNYVSITFEVTFLSPEATVTTDPDGGQVIEFIQDYASDDYFAEDYVGT